MTGGKCDYCNKPFVDGQSILKHEDDEDADQDILCFCNSECAGAHFVETECWRDQYEKPDDDEG